MDYLIHRVVRHWLTVGLLVGAAAAWWGVPRAYAARGGFACGGVWVLILVVVILPFILAPSQWRR